jgi:hypothetical protein
MVKNNVRGQATDHRDMCRTALAFFKNCNRGTLLKAFTLEFVIKMHINLIFKLYVFLNANLKCSGKYKIITVLFTDTLNNNH